jgi:hypothetical protein
MIKTTPMIFNSEMVRALLAGNKVQTRRIVKHQPFVSDVFPSWVFPATKKEAKKGAGLFYPNAKSSVLAMCPFGRAGDLIYVREKLLVDGTLDLRFGADDALHENDNIDWIYRGDPEYVGGIPSIHMPRWASRLTLKINSVRVERIQDISEEDAKKEGIKFYPFTTSDGCPLCTGFTHLQNDDGESSLHHSGRGAFADLWSSVYPKSWNKNEWVWVIDFEAIHKNIDHVLAEMEQAE